MTQRCIINVATTGSVPSKRDNPALPVTMQIESTHAAYEAGAALVHTYAQLH
jgi:3-keto-5-aminohexanoate cleavage enzyme